MNLNTALKTHACIGTILTIASPDVAELLSLTGVDWLMVDLEHSTLTPLDLKSFCQAAAGRCPVIARVPWNDVIYIKQVLDAGCDGVIVPQIGSAEEARQVVRHTKYRPIGERGVGLGRAHGFGFHFTDYIAGANAATSTIIQIEHIDAVKAIEDILSVQGIDAVFIGPFDLSDSMGLRGQIDHAEVAAAIHTVKKACEAKHIPVGIFAGNPEVARQRAKDGYRLIALGTDVAYLGESVKSAVSAAKITTMEAA